MSGSLCVQVDAVIQALLEVDGKDGTTQDEALFMVFRGSSWMYPVISTQ